MNAQAKQSQARLSKAKLSKAKQCTHCPIGRWSNMSGMSSSDGCCSCDAYDATTVGSTTQQYAAPCGAGLRSPSLHDVEAEPRRYGRRWCCGFGGRAPGWAHFVSRKCRQWHFRCVRWSPAVVDWDSDDGLDLFAWNACGIVRFFDHIADGRLAERTSYQDLLQDHGCILCSANMW